MRFRTRWSATSPTGPDSATVAAAPGFSASCLPIGATFIMVFSPPASLSGTGLVIWMAVAIIGFYSAMTVFFVPHLSLGAELSTSYHERSRLFGMRHGFYTFGSILSLISFYLLISAEQEGREVVRSGSLRAGPARRRCDGGADYRLREPPARSARSIRAG